MRVLGAHSTMQTSLIDAIYEVINVIASTRNALAHAYRRMSGEDLSAIVRDILPKVMELVRELFKLVELKGIDSVKAPLKGMRSLEVCLLSMAFSLL